MYSGMRDDTPQHYAPQPSACRDQLLLRQQECSSGLGQEDASEPPPVKEEQEEDLSVSRAGEPSEGGPEEADAEDPAPPSQPPRLTRGPENGGGHADASASARPVKSEPGGEDRGASEPFNPRRSLSADGSADESEDSESDERGGFRSGLNTPEVKADAADRQSSPSHMEDGTSPEVRPDGSPCSLDGERAEGTTYFECNFCCKLFRHAHHLESHIRIHLGEKPFRCNTCNKSFTQLGNLKHHMMTHTGEKPFECQVCHKTFSQKSNLKTHMIQHTGERQYVCKICGSTFMHAAHLRVHMRTHTGVKPYKCSVCEQEFTQSSNLRTHMRLHTGEKPYRCSFCSKEFVQVSGLQRHKLTHTQKKNKPFSCKECDKQFSRKNALKRHVKQKHTNANTLVDVTKNK